MPNKTTNKPRQEILIYVYRFVLAVALLILLWATFLFIKGGISLPIWNYFILFTLSVIIFVLHRTRQDQKIIHWIKKKNPNLTLHKTIFICMIVAILVGVILRCLFIAIGHRYEPIESLSDTGVHWAGGAMIANNGHLSGEVAVYEGFFPYLITYSATLSVFISIFGQNVLSIIISNLIFDLLAALFLYILLRKWQNQKVAYIGVIIWMLNPLEILYCGVGMAIIITNMFVILAILLASLCLQSFRTNKKLFLAYAAAVGLSVGLGNAYRPLFNVFIIAIAIVLILNIIQHKDQLLLFLSGMAVMIAALLLTNTVVEFGWHKVDSYSNGNTGVGWSFMLGANYDSWGRWNPEDSKRFGEGLSKENITHEDFLAMQKDFTKTGIDRYLSMSPSRFIIHILHKTEVLFADADGRSITWPVLEAYHVSENNTIYQSAHGAGIALLVIVIVSSFVHLYRQLFIQKQYNQTILFFALCFCGLIAASLLVEVMWRYVMPAMAILIVLSAPQINDLIGRINKFIN